MISLLKRMRRKEWLMAGLCALLVLGQIYFDLRLPDYMSDLTVLIQTPGSTVSDIWGTGLEMLGCTLASALLAVICGYLSSQVAAGFSYTVRESVFNQVADFGQKEMQQFSVPSLINRTTNDITQIQMLVAMGLQILIKSPVMAVWAVIKIINKSWTLSVITAGFVAALLLMMVVVIVVILPRVRRVQRLTDNINRVSRENLTGIQVVHAYNAEAYQAEKFEEANDALMKTQLFNQRALALLMPAVSFAMNALALVIYWVGASIVDRVAVTDMARTDHNLRGCGGIRNLCDLCHYVDYDDGYGHYAPAVRAGFRRAHQRGAGGRSRFAGRPRNRRTGAGDRGVP